MPPESAERFDPADAARPSWASPTASRSNTDRVSRLQRILALRSFPGMSYLPASTLAGLAENTRDQHISAGTQLYAEGQPVREFFFIIRGEVELRSRERRLRLLGDKSVVGGLSALAKEPIRYDVYATKPSMAIAIDIDDALDIYEDNFVLIRSIAQGISANMIKLRKQLGTSAGFSNVIADPMQVPEDRPLDLVERMAILYRVMTFANSRLEALADVARDLTEVRASAGSRIWSEGEPSGWFLVVVSGEIRCTTENDQHFRLGPGDAIGTMEGTAGEPRWYTVKVERDVIGLRVECEAFFDVMEDHFDMAVDMLASLASGTLRLNEAIATSLAS